MTAWAAAVRAGGGRGGIGEGMSAAASAPRRPSPHASSGPNDHQHHHRIIKPQQLGGGGGGGNSTPPHCPPGCFEKLIFLNFFEFFSKFNT